MDLSIRFAIFILRRNRSIPWWSYRFKAREKNAGWRIDYFCVSEDLKQNLIDAKIHTRILWDPTIVR